MKNIFLFLMVLLMVVSLSFAGTKTLEFGWQQDLPSPINDLAGWGLYQSSAPGGPYTKILDIPYVSPQTEYTSSTQIVVPDGQISLIYFVLDAVDTSGNRSGKSNEVTASIDFQPPGVPMQLKVTVTTPLAVKNPKAKK